MARRKSVLAGLLGICTVAAAQKDNGKECDCFRTNGSTEAYFSYHQFFDYRNVPPQLTASPAVLTNATETKDAGNSSAFFSDPSFTADWTIPNWDNSDSLDTTGSDATVLMINSANNVYIETSTDNSPDYGTYLTLRTARTEDFQSAGEIDSTALNYRYLSARFFARVVGDSGGCAGMFTYLCSTESCSTSSSNVQEADIEILTDGSRDKIQLTNQPSESPSGDTLTQATLNATLPDGVDWTVWNEYRYDWLPGMSTWYVNGVHLGSISFQAPKDQSGIIINMWSNGGSWTGNMSINGAAYLQIQWIELVYNTSGPVDGAAKVDSEKFNLAELSSMMPETSGHFGRLPEERDVHGDLEPRADSSSCFRVCSVDTNVTIVGTPVVVSIARREIAGSFTLSVILLMSVLGVIL